MEKRKFMPAIMPETGLACSKSAIILDTSVGRESRILTESAHELKVWNVTTGQCINTFVCMNSPVFSASFCRGGGQVLVNFVDGAAVIWDLSEGVCSPVLGNHLAVQ